MNKYSFIEVFNTFFSLIYTKLFFRKMRLIRLPIYVRGKKSIIGGEGLTTGYNCRFDLDGTRKTLFIVSECQFGDNTHIVALNHVEIGNNVLIASKVFISDTNHGTYSGSCQSTPYEKPANRLLDKKSTYIGDNVWIGENVVILAGSEVNSGAIIGANSIVNGKVDKNTIVAGTPARVIKTYNDLTNRWERFLDV
jgi:acetyltransferase-like isoleucine patch superfamily enzyme